MDYLLTYLDWRHTCAYIQRSWIVILKLFYPFPHRPSSPRDIYTKWIRKQKKKFDFIITPQRIFGATEFSSINTFIRIYQWDWLVLFLQQLESFMHKFEMIERTNGLVMFLRIQIFSPNGVVKQNLSSTQSYWGVEIFGYDVNRSNSDFGSHTHRLLPFLLNI